MEQNVPLIPSGISSSDGDAEGVGFCVEEASAPPQSDENRINNSDSCDMEISSSNLVESSEPPHGAGEPSCNEVSERKREEPGSSQDGQTTVDDGDPSAKQPSKRRLSVITISDTESDDSSDVCLVDSYQASASEAKRIRRGYSTSDSQSSSSDEEPFSDTENPTVVVSEAVSVLSKCNFALSQRAPRETNATFNPSFVDKLLMENLSKHWQNEEDFGTHNIKLSKDPFRLCILENFLENPDIIHNIIDDMTTLDWSRRKMDLYEFHRSSDLVSLSWQRSIKSFYDLLKDHLINWVSEITNLNLTHVSASCALYGPGDHLLVHDDLMNDRKVAFIYYMTPWNITNMQSSECAQTQLKGCPAGNTPEDNGDNEPKCDDHTQSSQWTDNMGGALQLLTTDDKGLPTVVVKSIFPNNNLFAFFKVGSKTFHQVSEVLTYDYPRLTINGWFHGPPEPTEPTPEHVQVITPVPYKDLKEMPHSELVQSSLNRWITSNYLSPRTKYKIQQQMENTSEISLEDFFLNRLYDDILNDLLSPDSCWEWREPAHLQHYEVLSMDKVGKSLKEMHQLFSSEHFLNLLSEFTDLRLTSYHSLEIQRWSAGSYTVIPPSLHASVTELDVIMYMGVPDKKISGGSTIYLAPEEAESIPLIVVEPLNNSLNVVYSDAGTTRFTKYVNKLGLSEGTYFYIITCSYRE